VTPSGTASTTRSSLSAALSDPASRAGLAMTSSDYPVTPGDVYSLSYLTASGLVTIPLIVDTDTSLSIANLGKVDARGMRFPDLRRIVEKKILDAYPLSAPRLIVQSCGLFPVYIQGEVLQSTTLYLWGLSRLSDLWSDMPPPMTSTPNAPDREGTTTNSTGATQAEPGYVTPYASDRDVTVRAQDGSTQSYDLFRAGRDGDLGQNPRLRPYDTVIFNRYSRSVSVSGAVRRAGVYQLLPGDSLKELIDGYCDGLDPKADPSRIVLTHVVGAKNNVGNTTIIDYAGNPNVELQNADELAVPSAQDLLPVVYFEGALGVGVNGAALQASQRIPYTFYPGETLGQATQKMRDRFSAVSDLAKAYVIRGDTKIAVDLSKFLYSSDFSSDIPLVQNDVVLVPFRQFFVSVSGGVKLPGRYPYIPDRSWDYYVNLAGGFDNEKNSGQKLDIIDVQGKHHDKTRLIQPEDSLVAAQNNPIPTLGTFAAIVYAVAEAIYVVITLIKM
jgi:protein involved in polysaccharide export with SLBB domain